MKMNLSAAILAGAVSLATVGGITYALVQSRDPATPEASSQPSTAAVPTTRTTTPATAAPPSPVAANPQAPIAAPRDVPEQQSVRPESTSQPPAARPAREVEVCGVSMAKVQDPAPPLNVRRTPSTEAEVVGKLSNDTWVTVEAEQDGWFRISEPTPGWIAKNRTDSGCNRKIERITFQDSGALSLADRFVGTGSHQYVLNLQKGQQVTITRGNGAFPAVTAPNGTALVEGPKDGTDRWSGQATQTGDYTITMDSNFKGYSYSFLVEIK